MQTSYPMASLHQNEKSNGEYFGSKNCEKKCACDTILLSNGRETYFIV